MHQMIFCISRKYLHLSEYNPERWSGIKMTKYSLIFIKLLYRIVWNTLMILRTSCHVCEQNIERKPKSYEDQIKSYEIGVQFWEKG